ncbi:hypothetical protein OY671_011148, partial [Metschnikowia pulcherrima]
ALRVLEFEGLIVARPRSGYFVCGAKPAIPEQVHPPEAPQPVMLSASMRTVYDHSKQITTPSATAFPDGEWLPQQASQRASQTVARRIGAEACADSSPPGRSDLRRQIAAHASAWGADFGPQDSVITAGETQAMRLALEATCRRGDLVAIESPAYFGLSLLLESLGV